MNVDLGLPTMAWEIPEDLGAVPEVGGVWDRGSQQECDASLGLPSPSDSMV